MLRVGEKARFHPHNESPRFEGLWRCNLLSTCLTHRYVQGQPLTPKVSNIRLWFRCPMSKQRSAQSTAHPLRSMPHARAHTHAMPCICAHRLDPSASLQKQSRKRSRESTKIHLLWTCPLGTRFVSECFVCASGLGTCLCISTPCHYSETALEVKSLLSTGLLDKVCKISCVRACRLWRFISVCARQVRNAIGLVLRRCRCMISG